MFRKYASIIRNCPGLSTPGFSRKKLLFRSSVSVLEQSIRIIREHLYQFLATFRAEPIGCI